MKIQKQIDVRLMKKVQTSSLRVVQFDTGVQLVFNVLDFTLPSETTATFYARKKSGKFIYQENGITVNANTVTVDLENQALTEHGEVHYQLRFLNGSDTISTFYGSMHVDPSLADADAEESKTVVSAFDALTLKKIAEIEAETDEFIAQAQKKVADKGVEVLATIPADYTETSRMADSATRTKADAIICSDEGDVVTVADAADDPLRGLKLFGKTTQKTTTGKNLFHNTATTKTVNGVTFTINEDGSITANGTATANIYFDVGVFTLDSGNYIFSGCTGGSTSTYLLYLQKDDGSGYVYLTDGEKTFTISDSDQRKLLIAVYNGKTVSNVTFRPMISVSGGEYEPYTGGAPSPSVDYPQSLESVGNNGTIGINVYGKNLLPVDSVTVKNHQNFVLPVPLPVGKYTFRANIVSDDTDGELSTVIFMNGNKNVAYVPLKRGNVTYTFNAKMPIEKVDFCAAYNYSQGENDTATWSNIQLECGDTVSEYEQSKDVQSISVSTPNGLPGIPVASGGNYTDANGQQWICDEVDLERGVYVKRIASVTFSGEEDWYVSAAQIDSGTRFDCNINTAPTSMVTDCLCNRFQYKGVNAVVESAWILERSYGFRIITEKASTVDEMKALLRENPTTMLYAMYEPQEVDLTAEEIETFKAVCTNYPNTTVLNDAGAWMEVKYNADTKTYLDNNTILKTYVTPQMFGAKGDGVTDDTTAIRRARDTAASKKLPLYFPAGTYLLSDSIQLWSGAEIFGCGEKSIITKIPAVTKAIKNQDSLTVNQQTVQVADISGLAIGQGCTIGHDWCICDEETNGVITAIDASNNTVTFSTVPRLTYTGISQSLYDNRNKGTVYISTSFPLFCSYRYKEDRKTFGNVSGVYIHDLCLDGNVQDDELRSYVNSPLYFDGNPGERKNVGGVGVEYLSSAYNEHIRIINITVKNSSGDGISVQSAKDAVVMNCTVNNCKYNGIHFGVASIDVTITNNRIYNCEFCGYFDCAGLSDVIISANGFTDCLYGIGGLDSYTRGYCIDGNTFTRCGVGILGGVTPYPANAKAEDSTLGNMANQMNGLVISNNSFHGHQDSMTGIGVLVNYGLNVIVQGNLFRYIECPLVLEDITRSVQFKDNVVRDCVTPLKIINSAQTTSYGIIVGNQFFSNMAGTSSELVIKNAQKMLVRENIIEGNSPRITVDTSTTSDITTADNLIRT